MTSPARLAGIGNSLKKMMIREIPEEIKATLKIEDNSSILTIIENGIADGETVDEAVRYSFGLRLPQLGPIENADMVGLDLTWNIHDYILRDLEDSHRPSKLLTQLRDEGKLGFKTGEGFMKWTPEETKRAAEDLSEYLIRMLYHK